MTGLAKPFGEKEEINLNKLIKIKLMKMNKFQGFRFLMLSLFVAFASVAWAQTDDIKASTTEGSPEYLFTM